MIIYDCAYVAAVTFASRKRSLVVMAKEVAD
jgi:hypothetical protein